MDKLKLIDKLREKANVSYEEAKTALENSDWDMLDAVLYLEENEKVKRPSVNIFYTNEARYNDKDKKVIRMKKINMKRAINFKEFSKLYVSI